MKLTLGIVIGFCLAAMFAPWNVARHADGKTEDCESSSGFIGGKKWRCTPQEKAALIQQQAGK